MKYRIFISSVQSEFAKERKALAKYIREDVLLGDFFEIFLFEEAPARNRSAQAVYLDEVEKQRHRCDHRQVYRTWPRASRVRSDIRFLQDERRPQVKMPKGVCVTARILDDRTYDAIASGEQRWWERIADDFWHDKFDGQNVTAIRVVKGMTDLEMTWEVTDVLLDEGIYLVTLGKRLA